MSSLSVVSDKASACQASRHWGSLNAAIPTSRVQTQPDGTSSSAAGFIADLHKKNAIRAMKKGICPNGVTGAVASHSMWPGRQKSFCRFWTGQPIIQLPDLGLSGRVDAADDVRFKRSAFELNGVASGPMCGLCQGAPPPGAASGATRQCSIPGSTRRFWLANVARSGRCSGQGLAFCPPGWSGSAASCLARQTATGGPHRSGGRTRRSTPLGERVNLWVWLECQIPGRHHCHAAFASFDTTPNRPATSWMNCHATRPDRAPRVTDHSTASACRFSVVIGSPMFAA